MIQIIKKQFTVEQVFKKRCSEKRCSAENVPRVNGASDESFGKAS